MMLFESSRVYFRKMTEDDVSIYHKWRNDMEVMRTTNPFMDMYTMTDTKDFVDHVILEPNSSKSYLIVDKESDKPIGITSLIHIDFKNRSGECIIDIGEKEYRGQGYGTESLKLLLDYAFLEMNLHRVSLQVFSFNEKAVKMYGEIGFKQEGVARQAIFREGKWHDIIQMGILQSEYTATY